MRDTYLDTFADFQNGVSVGTASGYTSGNMMDSHEPYVMQGGYDSDVPNAYVEYHFMRALRRIMSGEVTDSYLSRFEQPFYTLYTNWTYDTSIGLSSEDGQAIQQLDDNLMLLIQNKEVAMPERKYTDEHKWNKTTERTSSLFNIYKKQ